jgi:hypothetical protein
MQQNDVVLSETMNVAVANVTLITSSNVAIVNGGPNQPRNVTMTHTLQAMHGQMPQLLKYIKRGKGWGKRNGEPKLQGIRI